ncbi:hypothetical protein COEREDRAFT_84194 [Coemansia reversa NRRL 1564]|uniref:Uncharacterized protein n=1 Tax=Coemansia reversa (strain ATCC 12441 / NRRL 1564) TaxID=763665 RepID=A0A2G5BKL9_COERN|nr:hypothetical protein COEREDRAFT_84194 [Coemansia reversa NRRL 1564]|eukprot:PIA19555.1 hypothetical protein COEREDRAFT_84194 [Coemansia reversa NRRL 1564]
MLLLQVQAVLTVAAAVVSLACRTAAKSTFLQASVTNEEQSEILGAPLAALSTLSEPRSSSINIVLPTMAIKITGKTYETDAATVIASGTLVFDGDSSDALSSHLSIPGKASSKMAIQKRKITADDDALFSVSYITIPNVQGIDLTLPPPAPVALPTPPLKFTALQLQNTLPPQPMKTPLSAIPLVPLRTNYLPQTPGLLLNSQVPLDQFQITADQKSMLIPTSSARAAPVATPSISNIESVNVPSVASVASPPPLELLSPLPSVSILPTPKSILPETLSSLTLLSDSSPSTPIFESSRDISLVDNAAGDEIDNVYPQNTPIIPFISNGVRQDVPLQDSDEKTNKETANANGIASILQNIFHVPPEKITIDGRPVLDNYMNQLDHGGSIDVMVMDPGAPIGSIIQGKVDNGGKGKNDDDDDDLLDDLDDNLDSEPVTHSLNVDRFRHRNRGRNLLAVSEFQSKGISTIGIAENYHSGIDDSDASEYNSDSGRDNNKKVEDSLSTFATPTKAVTHSDDGTMSQKPTATKSHQTDSPTPTDAPNDIASSNIISIKR